MQHHINNSQRERTSAFGLRRLLEVVALGVGLSLAASSFAGDSRTLRASAEPARNFDDVRVVVDTGGDRDELFFDELGPAERVLVMRSMSILDQFVDMPSAGSRHSVLDVFGGRGRPDQAAGSGCGIFTPGNSVQAGCWLAGYACWVSAGPDPGDTYVACGQCNDNCD